MKRLCLSVLCVAAAACESSATPDASDVVSDRSSRPDVIAPADVVDDVATDVIADSGVIVDTGVAMGEDNAAIAEETFPRSIGCTARARATITMRNSGTTTWSAAGGYALGVVGGGDPLFTTAMQVALPAGASVAPGGMHTFEIPFVSPGRAGTVTTDWRMTRTGRGAFGAMFAQDVVVSCDMVSVSDFRLADVEIVSSPDVRGFAVTSRITELAFRSGTFHIDHTRRGMWPPVVIAPDGTTQEATVWVFFRIAGRWYATGGERLRPNQTDKALTQPSEIGPDWLYDPNRWRIMTGYVPSVGDLVGFMVVAGSTRSDNQTPVRERSGVVLVRFPADGTTAMFPPFEYQEP